MRGLHPELRTILSSCYKPAIEVIYARSDIGIGNTRCVDQGPDMKFDHDAFISYWHEDNKPYLLGGPGWVSCLHDALRNRLPQELGRPAKIWLDNAKLEGNDVFAETIAEQLRQVAVLIAVVSRGYINSGWTETAEGWTRRELLEFRDAAQRQGGLHVEAKSRIFKILRKNIEPEDQPEELRDILGYEFFAKDQLTGKVHELVPQGGPDNGYQFQVKLDDLLDGMRALFEVLEQPDKSAAKTPVFLAETTSDLKGQRDAIKRVLQKRGCAVLPSRELPLFASEMEKMVRENLAGCRISIHLIGKDFDPVMQPRLEIQNRLAIDQAKAAGFLRILWIPRGLQVEDEGQARLIEKLRMAPNHENEELLETSPEDLVTFLEDRLKQIQKPIQPEKPVSEKRAEVYLIYGARDAELTHECVDYLQKQGLEVIRPAFEGDEAEIREYHQQNLRECDGVIIFYGSASEPWLRLKLRDIQQCPGYGRTKPKPVVAVVVAQPKTPEKERFETSWASMVVRQFDTFSPEPLTPFVAEVKASYE
jgi:hypothetical protein